MAHAMKEQQQVTSVTHTIHIERDNEPCFKVLVRNLPLTVKIPRRPLLFSNYCKGPSTKVICHKKAKHSQCIGHVTMSTAGAELEQMLPDAPL